MTFFSLLCLAEIIRFHQFFISRVLQKINQKHAKIGLARILHPHSPPTAAEMETWSKVFGPAVEAATRRALARQVRIPLSKLKCLEPGVWLNDEVLNKCMELLQVRHRVTQLSEGQRAASIHVLRTAQRRGPCTFCLYVHGLLSTVIPHSAPPCPLSPRSETPTSGEREPACRAATSSAPSSPVNWAAAVAITATLQCSAGQQSRGCEGSTR